MARFRKNCCHGSVYYALAGDMLCDGDVNDLNRRRGSERIREGMCAALRVLQNLQTTVNFRQAVWIFVISMSRQLAEYLRLNSGRRVAAKAN